MGVGLSYSAAVIFDEQLTGYVNVTAAHKNTFVVVIYVVAFLKAVVV